MADDAVGLSGIPPADRKRLEEMGEAYVRQVGNVGGLPQPLGLSAIKWVAELDDEAKRRTEALQAEQIRFNKNTLRAAWIAAGAAIAGIFVTVGLWYLQYRIAEAEVAHRASIISGLQTLYEQGTDLMKEGLPLTNSVDLDKINKFDKEVGHFGDIAEKWVQENMGKACVDRLLEVPSGFQQMRGSNQQLNTTLNVLMMLKKDLTDIIDNDSCRNGK